jgi:hypothetical protein
VLEKQRKRERNCSSSLDISTLLHSKIITRVKIALFPPVCERNSNEVGFLAAGRLGREVKNPSDGNFSHTREEKAISTLP